MTKSYQNISALDNQKSDFPNVDELGSIQFYRFFMLTARNKNTQMALLSV